MKFTINHVNWPKDFPEAPQTTVNIEYDSRCLHIRYDVVGRQLRAIATEDQQPVWEDSCVEFFCRPLGTQAYTNFECNCIGTMVATRRMGRDEDVVPFLPEQMKKIIRRSSMPHQRIDEKDGVFTWWVELDIPWQLITGNDYQSFPLTLECNFYKCGDLTRYPHFLSWKPILTPTPDFHCPQYFGKINFE